MTSQRTGKTLACAPADVEVIVEEVGDNTRYLVTQLTVTIFSSFMYAVPIMDVVFRGYQPDYRCGELNVTWLEHYLPDDVVTNFTLHDVTYRQCSIDVTVNTSGASSTHSLPCLAGVNFSMPDHTSFVTEWSLVCDKAGLSQATQTGLFAGQLLGSLLFSVLADRWGRKKVYVAAALGTTLSVVGMALVPSVRMLLAAKVAVGFFGTGNFISGYTMFMELVPRKWRSLGGVLESLFWGAGCLYLAGVSFGLQGLSWRYATLATYSLFAVTLLLPWVLDESIRWLLATGRVEEAEQILKRVCRTNSQSVQKIEAIIHKQRTTENLNEDDMKIPEEETTEKPSNSATNVDGEEVTVDEEVRSREELNDGDAAAGLLPANTPMATKQDEALARNGGAGTDLDEGGIKHGPCQPAVEASPSRYTVLDLCRHRQVLVPFLVTVLVWMSSNLYYYAVMLGSARLSGDRFLNFALLTLLDVPATLVCHFLMRRFNRRPVAFVYGLFAAFSLLLSVALVALGGGQGVTLTLATVAQYAGMFCLSGSYILLFVYIMEIYPTGMRAIGTGAAGTIVKVTTMAAPFLLLWGEDTPWAPGVLVGCLSLVASFCIWLLPETRHRRLPDTIAEVKAWNKLEKSTAAVI